MRSLSFLLALAVTSAVAEAGTHGDKKGVSGWLCPSGDWCEPLAQQSQWFIGGAPGDSPTTLLAVTSGGALLKWNGSSWAVVAAAFTNYLTSAWGTGPTDIWAVGGYGDKSFQHYGAIAYHWNGNRWSVAYKGTGPWVFDRVWGAGRNDVWVAGGTVQHVDGAPFFHFDGSKWSESAIMARTPVSKLFGNGSSDVTALGESDAHHFNGKAWEELECERPVSSSRKALRFGCRGQLQRWVATGWEDLPDPGRDAVHLLLGGSPATAWALGPRATVMRFDGNAWEPIVPKPLSVATLRGVWGSSDSDLWFAGEKVLMHWDGRNLSTQETAHSLNAVWGPSRDDIWAVGDEGVLLHFAGGSWQSAISPTTRALRAVWGSSATDIWAVGDEEAALHFDGKTWTSVAVPAQGPLRAVWGAGSQDVWVGGGEYESRALLRWIGGNWSPVPHEQFANVQDSVAGNCGIRAIWGQSPTDVWASTAPPGAPGTVALVHWDGKNWSVRGESENIEGICGRGERVWAVGTATALRWDGKSWRHTLFGAPALNACWVTPSGATWAVGWHGAILRTTR